MTIDAQTKIAVIDDDPTRFLIVQEGLHEAGYANVIHIRENVGLLDVINRLQPDVIVIGLGDPNRDVLEQMFHLSRIVPRPVVMFVEEADSETIGAAIDAGVSAYIVDGLRKERVRNILEASVLRYRAFAAMKAELTALKTQLEERKVIERAKGIIMEAKGVTEEQAYQIMKKQSMATNRKIVEIANSVVLATDLLK